MHTMSHAIMGMVFFSVVSLSTNRSFSYVHFYESGFQSSVECKFAIALLLRCCDWLKYLALRSQPIEVTTKTS